MKATEAYYSVRLMRPWLALLRRYPAIPKEALDELEARDLDDRIPAAEMIQLARASVTITGDPDLGLKAAQAADPGEYDVLEYAASSASTVRESIEIVLRYVALVNDGIRIETEQRDGVRRARIHSSVLLDRATADFQLAAFVVAAKRRMGHALNVLEVWHRHPEPEDLSEYRKVYGNATLRFSEPVDGIAYDASVLDMPVPSADPKLHRVLERHAQQLLDALPRVKSTGERVRAALVQTLSSGSATAESVARGLHMSRRTMTRRLEEEGTSYKTLLEEVRQHLAKGYLSDTTMGVGEVAFLLGFSQGPAFHRAFKRWTGKTPLAYRREHRKS